jgi:hypothetical protein
VSVEELEAEKQCTEKIAVISQQLKKIEAYMKEVKEAFKKEMDLERETSLITILTRAEATFAACTCYFERLQSEAAKLQLEISTKSEDVRNLKTAMKEAKTRVRKSEIEYETFDRMELTTLLHVMVREERLAAVWRELAPKIKTFEDLEYQHGAAEEEENKLKEELRAANVRLNQAKNECEEADRELEKVRKEFDRLKENLDLSQIEYESQRKAKSIELLDAKDNLLKLKALEISRRRKELLMERKELAASHPSAPLSINSQFSLPGEFFFNFSQSK